MNFNPSIGLCGCSPKQIISFNIPINTQYISSIKIYNNCNDLYNNSDLEYAYSLDNVCWSCYIDYSSLLSNTVDINQDIYLRIKVSDSISKIELLGTDYIDYSTQLDSSFNFTYCDINSNMYNPYTNMTCAMDLNRQMSDLVCCMFGIPIIYFKVNPESGSKDITFKEYTFMNVYPPKHIKMIIQDGQMPSSKPEFNDFGLDFQTDWETEIGKTMFATAFGQNEQPMEGDFIWVPMMKRMWQVSGAYEEKKDAFMWNATTFKVSLVKYEEKGSVNLGDMESIVDSFVKNKYEDIFGDTDDTDGSGFESVESPNSAFDNLYPVYQSDATRKYVTCNGIDISDGSTYFKGTVISDSWYVFNKITDEMLKVVYQKQYCGDDITLAFIIKPVSLLNLTDFKNDLISIGNLKIKIEQSKLKTKIYVNKNKKLEINIDSDNTYFIYIRWSKSMNISEIGSILYTYNQNIPIYKVADNHYYYDVDNRQSVFDKWNMEYTIDEKTNIVLSNLVGYITNIKLYDIYIDNLSELLQQYPTNSKLIINDTARKLIGLDGVKIR